MHAPASRNGKNETQMPVAWCTGSKCCRTSPSLILICSVKDIAPSDIEDRLRTAAFGGPEVPDVKMMTPAELGS